MLLFCTLLIKQYKLCVLLIVFVHYTVKQTQCIIFHSVWSFRLRHIVTSLVPLLHTRKIIVYVTKYDPLY